MDVAELRRITEIFVYIHLLQLSNVMYLKQVCQIMSDYCYTAFVIHSVCTPMAILAKKI